MMVKFELKDIPLDDDFTGVVIIQETLEHSDPAEYLIYKIHKGMLESIEHRGNKGEK